MSTDTENDPSEHAVSMLRPGEVRTLAESDHAGRVPGGRLIADADDQRLLQQVVAYYHASLISSPEALAYLETRHIATGDAIRQFQIGYCDRTLGYRLPEKNRRDGAAVRGHLQRLGVLKSSGHERFRGSVVIPVFGADGEIVQLYGRKTGRRFRKGTSLHECLPGDRSGIWNRVALATCAEVILCRSMTDALSFWCAGYANVIAGIGPGWDAPLFTEKGGISNIERVILAMPGNCAGGPDPAGLIERCRRQGIECYLIHFPKGKDANDIVCAGDNGPEQLGELVRGASWMGHGFSKAVIPGRDPVQSGTQVLTDNTEAKVPDENKDHPSQHERVQTVAAGDPNAFIVATVLPEPAKTDIPTEIIDQEIRFLLEGRRYRVRGLESNPGRQRMKINLFVSSNEHVHVDNLDLYQARARAAFIRLAAIELGLEEDVIKQDIGKILIKLESLQSERIHAATTPRRKLPDMTEAARKEAMALLQDPKLLDRILDDFVRCGIVGEENNKLVAYLAAVSRKLDKPLAVMVQSSSAAGKSSLMDAVLALVPDEDKVEYSALTGQSLYYLAEGDLQHKILAIAEEAGAARASYALKLLQSEGELSIASTGKDPHSGRHRTQRYRAKGPVMIFSTTTSIAPDEELLNRCIVLGVDEGRAQTRAIHRRQREARTARGFMARQARTQITRIHHNAQRLLKPLAVINPLADDLTFQDDRTRLRRDHEKYLTLIDSIALLHQHQRPVKEMPCGGEAIRYVEVTLADITIANRLAHAILGQSLDELPPQTRRLLMLLDDHVNERCHKLKLPRDHYHFTCREVREAVSWGNTQLRIHLSRLVELEYLGVRRGANGCQYKYELRYDGKGKDGRPFMMGLVDVPALENRLAGTLRGENGSQTPPAQS